MALDAATGDTLWEYRYRSAAEDFDYGAGPHATPIVLDELVVASGTNKQIVALEKATGRLVWSRNLVRDFGALPLLEHPAVRAGYAVSPLAYRDLIIVTAGGEGQAVIALRAEDGSVAWRGGDFLLSHTSPILIDVGGQTQLVVVGGQTVNGVDPETGEVLWTHEHDTAADMNISTPVWGDDGVLFLSAAYNNGSRALRLLRENDGTRVEQLWFTNQLRLMFANAIRLGDHVIRDERGLRPGVLRRARHPQRPGRLAQPLVRAGEHGVRGRQGHRDGRGRLAGAGAAVARRTDGAVARGAVRHHLLDGAVTGRHHALRQGPRADRGARPR